MSETFEKEQSPSVLKKIWLLDSFSTAATLVFLVLLYYYYYCNSLTNEVVVQLNVLAICQVESVENNYIKGQFHPNF